MSRKTEFDNGNEPMSQIQTMKPKIWKTGDAIPSEAISEAAVLLRQGGLLIYPTETFYALGAIPFPGAVERIFGLKGREFTKALPLIASTRKAVLNVVSGWSETAEKLAQDFWPGPLTLILPANSTLPPILLAGSGKVAVRISPHPVASRLAESAGGLLVSTSANKAGQPPQNDAAMISGEVLLGVDGFVDAGNLAGGFPSTIVDVTVQPPKAIRVGRIGWEEIRRSLAGISA
jgi:L-threonylcarbamoyladenylate synthase